jgi:hypothetical protein
VFDRPWRAPAFAEVLVPHVAALQEQPVREPVAQERVPGGERRHGRRDREPVVPVVALRAADVHDPRVRARDEGRPAARRRVREDVQRGEARVEDHSRVRLLPLDDGGVRAERERARGLFVDGDRDVDRGGHGEVPRRRGERDPGIGRRGFPGERRAARVRERVHLPDGEEGARRGSLRGEVRVRREVRGDSPAGVRRGCTRRRPRPRARSRARAPGQTSGCRRRRPAAADRRSRGRA